MAGQIVPWNTDRIRHEQWLRLAFHPASRNDGRVLVIRFTKWFAAEGRDACMIQSLDHAIKVSIAFRSTRDAVLFKLFHPEFDGSRVRFPHAHDHLA